MVFVFIVHSCTVYTVINELFISQFAVHYKARNNTDVSREVIIKLLASLVTQNGEFSHTVDLSNPDLSVVVEIIKVHIHVCNVQARTTVSFGKRYLYAHVLLCVLSSRKKAFL